MKRHDLDLVSLFFGLLFALAGGLFLVADVRVGDVDWSWAGPFAAGLIGAMLLAVAIRRARAVEASFEDSDPPS